MFYKDGVQVDYPYGAYMQSLSPYLQSDKLAIEELSSLALWLARPQETHEWLHSMMTGIFSLFSIVEVSAVGDVHSETLRERGAPQ